MSCRVWRAKKLETIERVDRRGVKKLLESGIEAGQLSRWARRGALYLRKRAARFMLRDSRVPVRLLVRSVRSDDGESGRACSAYAESQDVSEEDAVVVRLQPEPRNVVQPEPHSRRAGRSLSRELLRR